MSEQATPLLSDEDLAYKLGAWSINRVGGDEVSIDLHLEIYDFACDIRDDMQTALDAASERVRELEHDRHALIKLLEDGWPIDNIEEQIAEAKKVWPLEGSEGDE